MRHRRQDRLQQYDSEEFRGLQGRLATNVRRLREARGLTQEQAADLCGMATRLLQRVEAGGSNVTFATLARLSAGFGLDAGELLAGGDRPE
ncbi:MAG: helix-turn-helix domain-containing protein [Myxococcota bacterium]